MNQQVPEDALSPSPITIRVDDLPGGFWQTAPCPTCHAKVGEYCLYPSGRVAHTRHSKRDAAVRAASAVAVVAAAQERLSEARR